MNKTETHPVELLIVAGLVALEAVIVLAAAAAALVMTLHRVIRRRPTTEEQAAKGDDVTFSKGNSQAYLLSRIARDAPEVLERVKAGEFRSARAAAPAPAVHPLSVVAAELAELPVSRLRPMVGTRSKRIRKSELVALAVAC